MTKIEKTCCRRSFPEIKYMAMVGKPPTIVIVAEFQSGLQERGGRLTQVVTDKSKRTTISVLRRTKGALSSMKHSGQSYDGVIQELVKFYKERRLDYWTRRKVERESGHRGRDDRY